MLKLPRRFIRTALGAGFVLTLGAGTGTVLAQQLPSSLDPNRIEQRFEKPALPQSRPPVTLPAPEQAPPPEQAGAIKFILSKLDIDGATVFSREEIAPLYQSQLGKEISLLDLYKIRDAITVKYRNAGYILSLAAIPAQEISDGKVHISVVEGYFNKVTFQGQATDRFGVLQDYAQKLKDSRPLRASVLERYTMLMDDLPGLKVRTVIQPAEGGAIGSDLLIILERNLISAGLSLDNRGTQSVGPHQIGGDASFNDVLGLFDQTTVSGTITPHIDELRYLDISHNEPIGLDGSTLSGGIRQNWSIPGDTVRRLLIKSQGITLWSGLSYPLIRSRSETLRLNLNLTYKNSRTTMQGDQLSDDRIRFITGNINYDISDPWQGSNLFQLGLNRGLDIMNATNPGLGSQSRALARPNFTKVTFSAQRVQPLPENLSILVATEGQFSPDVLTSGEEFGIGGKLYGRAFDSSELTGSKGASVKLELQHSPQLEIPKIQYVQFFIFADYGKVWKYQSGDTDSRQELASFGAGVRFGMTEALSGTVEFGQPFLRNTTANNNRDPRVFFSLSARY
ncbi:MAG: ShlB/FhaC/HecB family hemolysin secretion/activation protein [Rhodospirillaceae bacterium]